VVGHHRYMNSHMMHPMVSLPTTEVVIAQLPCNNLRRSSIGPPAHRLTQGELARTGQWHLSNDQPNQHQADKALSLGAKDGIESSCASTTNCKDLICSSRKL
jgi:hypothetical protein